MPAISVLQETINPDQPKLGIILIGLLKIIGLAPHAFGSPQAAKTLTAYYRLKLSLNIAQGTHLKLFQKRVKIEIKLTAKAFLCSLLTRLPINSA